MYGKFLAVFVVLLQCNIGFAQRQWVLPTTTAAEMRNPYTWYWPYAIAGAEAYRDFFQNAQQITNQMYQQAYATNAFPWMTGQTTGPAGQVAGQAGQAAGQAGQAAGQAGQAAQGATGMVNPNGGMNGQGGQGWNGQG